MWSFDALSTGYYTAVSTNWGLLVVGVLLLRVLLFGVCVGAFPTKIFGPFWKAIYSGRLITYLESVFGPPICERSTSKTAGSGLEAVYL